MSHSFLRFSYLRKNEGSFALKSGELRYARSTAGQVETLRSCAIFWSAVTGPLKTMDPVFGSISISCGMRDNLWSRYAFSFPPHKLLRRFIHVFEDRFQPFFLLRSSAILNCVALRCQSGIGFHVALRRLQSDRPCCGSHDWHSLDSFPFANGDLSVQFLENHRVKFAVAPNAGGSLL